jgi:hypothetical protein
VTAEPTVLVPMTRAMRDVAEFIGESYGVVPKADREVALALVDAYDAAAARPVEPGEAKVLLGYKNRADGWVPVYRRRVDGENGGAS